MVILLNGWIFPFGEASAVEGLVFFCQLVLAGGRYVIIEAYPVYLRTILTVSVISYILKSYLV